MRHIIQLTFAIAAVAASTAAQPAERSEAVDTVVAFHAALAAGDGEGALALLDPDGVVFEAGGAELSREEYEQRHLGADMEFAAATEREILDRRVGEAGEVAWVLTLSRTTGTFRGRAIDSRGAETMILRRSGDAWRIVHIHWSSQ